MSKLLSHSDYWCLQAQEARLAAQRIEAPSPGRPARQGGLIWPARRLQQRVGNPAVHCWIVRFTPNSDREIGHTRCKRQMCATKRADGGARLAHAGLLWSVASLVGWPNKVLVVVLLIELGQ